MPFDKIVAAVCPEAKLRKLVKNMIYVGVAAQLLDIDMDEVEKALRKQFAQKGEGRRTELGRRPGRLRLRRANLPKQTPSPRADGRDRGQDHHRRQRRHGAGRMFAGVTVVTWYPITPSSSLVEPLIDFMKSFRIGADGKATFAMVQAEDELAAIGMVLGAGWAGARSMTATSGPGISLMAEFAGLGYFAEIPGVIFDIQRVGPSTGLPTRTAQGDILSIAVLSHGDTKHVMLLPVFSGGVLHHGRRRLRSCRAAADPRFRPVRSRSGHEQLDVRPVRLSGQAAQPRQGSHRRDLERLGGFARYKDVDGDGIRYRTLPGTDHPKAAYFTRGSGHNENASTPSGPTTTNNMDRLARKFDTARTLVPRAGSGDRQVEDWHHRLWHIALRAGRKPRSVAARNTASRPITCAFAPIPLPRKFTILSPRTSAFTSSNRTATPRCSAC